MERTESRSGYFSGAAVQTSLPSFYRENGFAVIEGAITPADIEALKNEVTQICRGNRGQVQGLPELAPGDSDAAVLSKVYGIYTPHRASALMLAALHYPPVVAALTAIISPNVKAMSSMLFVKSAGRPGQEWHQDESFVPTRDRSLTAAWIALDDATVENGCLWVVPGSHRCGVLWKLEAHNDPEFDCIASSRGFPYTDRDAIALEVKAGSVILFDGHLLHRSLPNRAPAGTYRRSLINHYMSAESLLPWGALPEGVSIAEHDFRDVIMVAGTDPHAWKGYSVVNGASIRPAGDQGCNDGQVRGTA